MEKKSFYQDLDTLLHSKNACLKIEIQKQFKAIFIHKGSLEGHAKESTVIECFSCIAKLGRGVEVDVIKLGLN